LLTKSDYTLEITEKRSGFLIRSFESIVDISAEWDNVIGDANIFLSSAYLKALENFPPSDMRFIYTIVFKEENPVGIIYCQLKHFNAAESLNYKHLKIEKDQWVKILSQHFKEFIAGKLDFHALICGNTFVTGEHAYFFKEDISEARGLSTLDFVLGWLRDELMARGDEAQIAFVKDFFNPVLSGYHKDYCSEYNETVAQPTMILTLDQRWNHFDDYMAALQSKYRVRARKAKSLCRDIVKRELQEVELEALQERMFELYEHIANNATFNLMRLHPGYITALKSYLGDNFRVIGYFEYGELISFHTAIINNDEVDAHFLGYHYEKNRKHQIYLNMLFDLIELGINMRKSKVIFGRTALEIKSSVGATPHQMYSYLQHRKGLPNRLLPVLFQLLNPGIDWVQRKPFKNGYLDFS
jgi:hypothetical protein